MTTAQHRYQIGYALPKVRKQITQEKISRFEICSGSMMDIELEANFHMDPEQAKKLGLSAPIASGMMSTAYLNEMLATEFGDAWTRTGHIALTFIASLYAGDEAIACGQVKAIQQEEEGTRVELEVWCESQDGKKATVGTAQVVVR
ncbi:MAG: MaoC family dehydratase [Chloroflexota bacterium]